MNYQIDYRSFSGIFAVPTQVLPLLNQCSGTALKVLLQVLGAPQEPISSARLSGILGYPPADVEEALDYWCKQGVLSSRRSFEEEESEQLSFLPKPKVRRVSSRRSMTNQEMDLLCVNDPNVSYLIQEAQAMLGRPLSSPERETLCSFYSYDDLSVEYLMLVLMYCINQEKTNFRYFEKVVNNMLEKGVDSYDKAERYLQNYAEQEQNESLVRSAFGIHDRALTTKEKSYISAWFDDFGYDISVIKLAYERTIDNIGKPSFPYTNKILSAWHEKGIKDAREASLESASFSSGQKKTAAQNKSGMASSFDMDELQMLLDRGGKAPF